MTDPEQHLPFRIRALGEFPPGRVHIHWSDIPRPTCAALEAAIERHWTSRLAKARDTGVLLFNGPLCRLIRLETRQDHLHLHVGPTDYREFAGTNLAIPHRRLEFGHQCYSNPVGTTAVVLTADGHLVYGRRNRRVAYHAGYLHTIGGGLQPDDRAPDGLIDPFASVAREIGEELPLHPTDINTMLCVGVIEDREIFQPEMLFEVAIPHTRDDLLAAFAARTSNHPEEHDRLETCPADPDAAIAFMLDAAPIAPVAVGSIMVFGLRRWGRGWYRRAAEALATTASVRQAAGSPAPAIRGSEARPAAESRSPEGTSNNAEPRALGPESGESADAQPRPAPPPRSTPSALRGTNGGRGSDPPTT